MESKKNHFISVLGQKEFSILDKQREDLHLDWDDVYSILKEDKPHDYIDNMNVYLDILNLKTYKQ